VCNSGKKKTPTTKEEFSSSLPQPWDVQQRKIKNHDDTMRKKHRRELTL
jgi:hypothetical protein